LAAVFIALQVTISGRKEYEQGDYLTIEAKFLDAMVRIPICGPIEAVLAGLQADFIELGVETGKASSDAIFLPFLVSYFERHRGEIEGRHKGGRDRWPDPWQMAWAIRNAASHNGQVFERPSQKPVAWRGLTFAPSDEPARSLLSLVNGGDIMVLLLDMEEARTGVSLKKA
jgi:hypothetical protein